MSEEEEYVDLAEGDYGYEEGDVCNRDGCRGIIEIEEPEVCGCHNNPPC